MPYKESIFKKIESHKKAVNTTDLLVHVFPNFNLAIERHKFPSGFSHPPPYKTSTWIIHHSCIFVKYQTLHLCTPCKNLFTISITEFFLL